MKTTKGGCMCGAVTYEVSGDPMFVGHCACENCQKATGAGHSTVAAFPEAALSVSGAVASYTATGDTGQPIVYAFCPTCGSRLFIRPSVMAGALMVSLGTMDPSTDLAPQMLIYEKRRRAWDYADPAIPKFSEMPPAPN